MEDSSSEKNKTQEYHHSDSRPTSVNDTTTHSKLSNGGDKEWSSPTASVYIETTSVTPTTTSTPCPDADESFPEGGRGWLVVLGCFIFAGTMIGWGLGWGVFQSYYRDHTLPGSSETVLSMLGSMQGLIMTIFSVITGKLADRYGYKPFFIVGAVLWVAGQIGVAFSTKLWHFFLTQGVIQGAGCAFVFPLILALPAQWFLKRRGFATGIIIGGCSVGGAVGALVLRAMLSSIGLRKTMLVYSGIDAVLLIIAILVIKERKPEVPVVKDNDNAIVWFDRAFLVDPVFWSLGVSLFLCVMGYLAPIFFLPTFVRDKIPGVSDIMTTVPVTVLNFSAASGRITIGFIADRVGPVNALFVVTLMSGLCQLLIFNFVGDYAGIMVFAVLYGFFCGSFLSLTPAVAARLYGADRLAGLSGLLLLFNVPGNGGGAPLTGALLKATKNNWQAAAGLNGGMQVLAAIVLLYARFKRERKIVAAF